MGELKRIDVAGVPAMFARHKVKPTQREWYGNRTTDHECRCGCIVSAVVIDGSPKGLRMKLIKVLRNERDDFLITISVATGMDDRYLHGLFAGWDGGVALFPYTEAYKAGYVDGEAAWEACQPLLAKGA